MFVLHSTQKNKTKKGSDEESEEEESEEESSEEESSEEEEEGDEKEKKDKKKKEVKKKKEKVTMHHNQLGYTPGSVYAFRIFPLAIFKVTDLPPIGLCINLPVIPYV